MGDVLGFTLTAMFNPTLIAVTTLMLLLEHPKRLMLGYLLGAWLVSLTLGLVIVFAAEDSSLAESGKHTINPAIDLALGGLLLVVALVLHSERVEAAKKRRAERKSPEKKKTPRWQRVLNKGDPKLAFVVGIVLTLPGASYLAALGALSKLDYSTGATVLVVVLINVIMLTLIELPLISFAVAPEKTPVALERVKAWFKANGRTLLTALAAIVGSLLILRGVIELIA